MKLALWTLMLLGSCQFLSATSYTFTATHDHYFDNPANWFPHYPGTDIQSTDTLYLIQSAHFKGYDLQIAGHLSIALGVELFSAKDGLVLHAEGSVDNHGQLNLHHLFTQGYVCNRMGANLSTHYVVVSNSGFLHNACCAHLTVYHTLTNAGTFHNYGSCAVMQCWSNQAQYFQAAHASLVLKSPPMVPRHTSRPSIPRPPQHP